MAAYRTACRRWSGPWPTARRRGSAAYPPSRAMSSGHLANAQGAALDIRLTISVPAKVKVSGPRQSSSLRPTRRSWRGFHQTWRRQVLAKGWGAAVLDVYSVQPDSGDGLTGGIIGLASGAKPRGLGAWGALRAWAWGASRAMDYFETDPAIVSGPRRHHGAFAFRQGRAGRDGVRSALRRRVHLVLRRGRRQHCCAAITRERIENLAGGVNIIGSTASS